MKNSILCPHCNREFELSELLRHEIEEKVKKETQERTNLELTDLRKALSESQQKVDAMREQELALRQEKRRLQEKEKELALEIDRRLDEEKQKITAEILKTASEQHRLKDLEKDKKINDLMSALEEAKRKAEQGSQQTQGEVLELDLEELLRSSFLHDEILPVGKGVRGADIKQVVKSPRGYICGSILWESKRTKAWSDGWIVKLKEDLRDEKANVPVIVSTVLPKESESGIGLKDGVWVVSHSLVLAIATLLRKSLLDAGYERAVSSMRGEKAEFLYEYVTGHEFRQQVENLAEVYQEMQTQLQKERVAFEKSWKLREGQIRRMIISTARVYGSMQGLVGSSMPQVKGLEMMELGDGED